LHWGVRLYDPKAVRTEPLGFMETQMWVTVHPPLAKDVV
jgi:hypothetical protein